ncbi:hypothetical protein A9Q84_07075 [Halobacteriovorax marinus]|uniref:HPt domain-containing protein n=1 Tax=Halobacteriovorax marinus TaxID=97084 RepID=A0A1Y5F5F4_9BACT|nr:hypothetical protein A9Q84_07075 [Halobacteriovorax marinus]
MYFGSYLVRKEIIKIEDFITCATEQIKSNKTLLEIVFENSILNEDQILSLVDKQYDSKKTFVQIIRESDLIEDSKLLTYYESSSSNQKSFSDILKEKSILGQDDLLKYYEDYEKSNVSDPKASIGGDTVEISSAALESLKELEGINLGELATLEKSVEVPAEISTEASSDEPQISAAALESLKELDAGAAEGLAQDGEQSSAFVDDFLDIFSDHLYTKLNKIIGIIFKTADEEGDFSNFFNSLFRELHIIKGAARLAHFAKIEGAIGQWEAGIEFFFNLSEKQKKSWLKEHGSSLSQLVELCWDIRNKIATNNSETSLEDAKLNEISGICENLKKVS